ncbi:MAG: hypothetical protein EXR59_01315 [Dehalococcoidia bacterium]|nr:hypothetical protein [Dehalococcoidia bacterium]
MRNTYQGLRTQPEAVKKVSRANWMGLLGSGSFFFGVVLATITGLWWPNNGAMLGTLVLLGLAVGVLNITGKEVVPFLVSAIALVVIGTASFATGSGETTGVFGRLDSVSVGLGSNLDDIVRNLAIFVAPAAILNALRAAIALARPGQAD